MFRVCLRYVGGVLGLFWCIVKAMIGIWFGFVEGVFCLCLGLIRVDLGMTKIRLGQVYLWHDCGMLRVCLGHDWGITRVCSWYGKATGMFWLLMLTGIFRDLYPLSKEYCIHKRILFWINVPLSEKDFALVSIRFCTPFNADAFFKLALQGRPYPLRKTVQRTQEIVFCDMDRYGSIWMQRNEWSIPFWETCCTPLKDVLQPVKIGLHSAMLSQWNGLPMRKAMVAQVEDICKRNCIPFKDILHSLNMLKWIACPFSKSSCTCWRYFYKQYCTRFE